MSRGWTKLFAAIVTSSIWMEDDKVVRVWVAMLALCDTEGVVEGSIPGFANIARVTVPEMEHAIQVLSKPDRHSRTPDNEGRRIESITGGWRVLNYLAYRDKGQDKDGSRAPYMRARRQQRANVPCNSDLLRVTQKREERSQKAEERGETHSTGVSGVSSSSLLKEVVASTVDLAMPAVSQIISAFNEIAVPGSPWPPVSAVEAAQLPGLLKCLTVPGWTESARALFALMPDHEISPFLAGKVRAKKPGNTPFNPEDAFAFLVADPSRVPAHLKRVQSNQKRVQRTCMPLPGSITPADSEAALARLAAIEAAAMENR